jgi:hypothetical protein
MDEIFHQESSYSYKKAQNPEETSASAAGNI